MKEGAENVERKIQAKVESLKNVNEGDKGKIMKQNYLSLFFLNSIDANASIN